MHTHTYTTHVFWHCLSSSSLFYFFPFSLQFLISQFNSLFVYKAPIHIRLPPRWTHRDGLSWTLNIPLCYSFVFQHATVSVQVLKDAVGHQGLIALTFITLVCNVHNDSLTFPVISLPSSFCPSSLITSPSCFLHLKKGCVCVWNMWNKIRLSSRSALVKCVHS